MVTGQPIHVLVAGVPYGLPNPSPDGRWLTDDHIEQIQAVSSRIELVHTTRDELEAGQLPTHPPEIIMIETTGATWQESEWLRHLVRGEDFQRLVTPALHWVHCCAHGVEHVLPLVGDSVLVTRGRDIHSAGLAETVIAAILFHAKRLAQRIGNQTRHSWELLDYDELLGQTICIVGTGSTGSAVARVADALGMRVIGVRRTPRSTPHFAAVVGPDELHSVLPESNILILACPLTRATRDMIGAKELQALPRGAYFVNVARGEIVNETGLLGALSSGHLGGCFLDVFSQEPLPAEHPLWDAPNTLIIPHDSHSSRGVGDRNVGLFCENLRRYLAREPLIGLVDRSAGY